MWGEKALNWNAIGTPFGTLCGHSDAEMERGAGGLIQSPVRVLNPDP